MAFVTEKEKKKELKNNISNYMKLLFRRSVEEATPQQLFQAVSYAIKDIVVDDWMATHKAYEKKDVKTVYYLSMEFLMGRALGNMIINLKEDKVVREVLDEMGVNLDLLEDEEPDAALGNGGLGRLAACFLDPLSTLGYPAYGCGIRYKYGMFKQKIENGFQIEAPDDWLKDGNPFEMKRPEYAVEVRFGGYVTVRKDEKTGRDRFVQENYQSVMAVPYDLPVVGYGNHIVNTLRIWDAEAIDTFNLDSFDKGDYQKAVEQQNLARTICEVLYPNDNHMAGKELRLKQQYFFVSASVQRAIMKYMENHNDIHGLPEKVCFQLNDTHPTVTVPELMRILLDEYGLEWDDAWDITTRTCAYTNHTIMAEALEKWPLHYLQEIVPQLVPIIEILDDKVRRKYADESVAVIDRNDVVHMAHIDIHYGFSVNGVAALHTEILKETELHNFYQLYPEKFNNKTNGITFRRWLLHCNPMLADQITEWIGGGYKKDATELKKLEKFVEDEQSLQNLLQIKKENKHQLAEYLKRTQGIELNEDSVFDIQIKRLHEYKRQQMNALYVIYKYLEIKSGKLPKTPITVIFGAKAAPAYVIAKDIIHLILCLQELINHDPEVSPYLNVVMVENYNVTLAEKLIPACDISEQISLASKEASGTGNMKFMLNGAVTLGTEDGANVEIHQFVGDDNIYIFGAKSDEVIAHYEKSDYRPSDYYTKNPLIQKAVEFITDPQMMEIGKKENLERLSSELKNKDWFMTFLDLEDYIRTKERALEDYTDRKTWAKKMLVNISNAGFFSSDRTIREYNQDIWKLGE